MGRLTGVLTTTFRASPGMHAGDTLTSRSASLLRGVVIPRITLMFVKLLSFSKMNATYTVTSSFHAKAISG